MHLFVSAYTPAFDTSDIIIIKMHVHYKHFLQTNAETIEMLLKII